MGFELQSVPLLIDGIHEFPIVFFNLAEAATACTIQFYLRVGRLLPEDALVIEAVMRLLPICVEASHRPAFVTAIYIHQKLLPGSSTN